MTPPDHSSEQTADGGEATPSQALVVLALAQSAEPCAIARADGTLVFVNSAMLRAASLDPAAERPASLSALIRRFRAAGFDDPAAALDEVLRTGRAFEREVADFKSGRSRALRISPLASDFAPASTSSPPAPDDDSSAPTGCEFAPTHGRVLGFAFTARDVTRQRESDRLRGALVSLVSHELRTPLTSIGGFADLLAADEELPAEAREFLVIIREEAGRLARMVNAFFAGVQAGGDGAAAACGPVSLDELALEAVDHFARAAAERGVVLSQREGPRLPPVAAGRHIVRHVVASLLEESLRRPAAGAAVVVSTSLEATTVSLSIETRPAPRAAAGSGELPGGDALLRDLVEQHGGRLTRESDADAERVRITFPRL
jgi:signal transduction histidine kinase